MDHRLAEHLVGGGSFAASKRERRKKTEDRHLCLLRAKGMRAKVSKWDLINYTAFCTAKVNLKLENEKTTY